MDAIRHEFRKHPRVNVNLQFVVSRGTNVYVAPFMLILAVLRIIYMRARRSVDVIHINLSANGSAYRKFVVAALASALRIPYVVHLHSGEFGHFWESCNGFTRRRIGVLFVKSKFIIVLGRVWSDLVVTKLPEVADRVVIIPNSTGKQCQHLHTDGPAKILFLGRLSPTKGIADLLKSLWIIRHLNNWQATLAGDGAVAETRTLVEHMGLAERVKLPGWLEDGCVTAALKAADILVLPSLVENLPMCVVEAFAHGLAVVCTPVGALPEVVEHERTGLLVPANNASALASTLERLLTDPALRARLGIRARAEHATLYEIGAYVDKLVRLWRAASRGMASPLDPAR
jgi:glycosyltransferase involved in cell wall biosynthesis